MKAVRIILLALWVALPGLCHAQHELFNKYNDQKGVKSVYISKAMIEMSKNLFTNDISIGHLSGQLNSVQVLTTMDAGVKKDMRKDIRSLVSASKYELLMKQKGTTSSSEFYAYRKGDKVKELIMIVDGAATLKFVYLEGEMTQKDIQNIIMFQSSNWIECPDNLLIPENALAAIDALRGKDWTQYVDDLKKGVWNSLDGIIDLRDDKCLREWMDADTWKRFERGMNKLEERLKNL
ncbi:MAG: DUF4252 domain-containing protein [Bacteroides sp.]|nr:DUF4252 domain-containing protein [Bacteroides sp.]